MNHFDIDNNRVWPHYRLGLSAPELNSLIAIRNMFVEHAKTSEIIKEDDDGEGDTIAHTFNGFGGFAMNHGCSIEQTEGFIEQKEYNCNTKACIAGWMKIHEKGLLDNQEGLVIVSQDLQGEIDEFVKEFDYKYEDLPANKLFFPHILNSREWDDITLDQAIRAIDNFLYSGDPDWGNVYYRD